MSLENRISKLRFIVEELALSAMLADEAPTDFARRTLARHALIRAKDFIDHARQLRRPLIHAGVNVKRFHEEKEAYAKLFVESFQVTRDKLSGHVQDLDFGREPELWEDIDVVKLRFFADAAHDVYRQLDGDGCTDWTAIDVPELTDGVILTALRDHSASNRLDGFMRVASDPLASTRPGTAWAMNATPVHRRASQLALIRRWLADLVPLHRCAAPGPRVQRVVRSRILTDIVSFADCLITRSDAGTAQQLDGLDARLRDCGDRAAKHGCQILTAFVERYRFQERITGLRLARNILGGHVDDDENEPLEQLLARFDLVSIDDALQTMEAMWCVFVAACRATGFLETHTMEDRPIREAKLALGESATRPYNPAQPDTARTVELPGDWNDEAVLCGQLKAFCAAGEDADSARLFFWDACLYSSAVEVCVVSGRLQGDDTRSYEFRTVHRFLLERLQRGDEDAELAGILRLLSRLARGHPRPLAEIVLRYWAQAHCRTGKRVPDTLLVRTLGDIACWRDAAVRDELVSRMESDGEDVLEAIVAAFRLALRDPRAQEVAYRSVFAKAVAKRDARERVVLLAAIGSQIAWGMTCDPRDRADDHRAVNEDLVEAAVALGVDANMAATLIACSDYVGLCAEVADMLEAKADHAGAHLFVKASGAIVEIARHPQGRLNFSLILAMRGNERGAVSVCDAVVREYIHDPGALLHCARALTMTDSSGKIAAAFRDWMRAAYNLEADQLTTLTELDANTVRVRNLFSSPVQSQREP